jgi:hypothetical protein
VKQTGTYGWPRLTRCPVTAAFIRRWSQVRTLYRPPRQSTAHSGFGRCPQSWCGKAPIPCPRTEDSGRGSEACCHFVFGRGETGGHFRSAPTPQDGSSTEHEGLVTVARKVPQAVICLLSALQLHGLTTLNCRGRSGSPCLVEATCRDLTTRLSNWCSSQMRPTRLGSKSTSVTVSSCR